MRRPDVLTIDHQQIERDQLGSLLPASEMQAVKVG
jgi:hypothetical protein